jgi:outer membrane protein assembly factor BamC
MSRFELRFSRFSSSAAAWLLLPLLTSCSLLPDVRVPGMDRITGEDGMFRDRKEEYLQAETIPRTQIPAGLDDFIIDDLLVIPELGQTDAVPYPDPPRPMTMEGDNQREVVIQRMLDESWIIADVSPSQIWPRIRDYWRQSGVPIAVENPSEGLMDTGWFVLEGEVINRTKLRVIVDTGFQTNSSEVRILHMSGPQALPAVEQVTWPSRSVDSTIAYDFLLDLSGYLADVADLYQASSASLLARSLSSEGKATLENTEAGNPLLRLQAGYDRSWAAVRRALTRSNIAITEESSAQGLLVLDFDPSVLEQTDEEDEPGFFTKVVTLGGIFSGNDEARVFPIRLQLMETQGAVEVFAVPVDADPDAATQEAVQTLMRLIRNTIA